MKIGRSEVLAVEYTSIFFFFLLSIYLSLSVLRRGKLSRIESFCRILKGPRRDETQPVLSSWFPSKSA